MCSLLLEREEGRERERNIDVRETVIGLPPVHAPTRNQTHNLGMCPDWESNPQPFGVWDDAPTELPGQGSICIGGFIQL